MPDHDSLNVERLVLSLHLRSFGVVSGAVVPCQPMQQIHPTHALPRFALPALQVCACCLSSLTVDLTVAPAVAQAAAGLVAALAPPLLQLLALAADVGAPVGGGLLPCLLRLYSLALVLHASCAALHPQVCPAGWSWLL